MKNKQLLISIALGIAILPFILTVNAGYGDPSDDQPGDQRPNAVLIKADFFVAPSGNDSWSGTQATTDEALTDGPFRTMERARDAVRDRISDGMEKDIVVMLRGGTYQLDKTFVLGLKDAATSGHKITYLN